MLNKMFVLLKNVCFITTQGITVNPNYQSLSLLTGSNRDFSRLLYNGLLRRKLKLGFGLKFTFIATFQMGIKLNR